MNKTKTAGHPVLLRDAKGEAFFFERKSQSMAIEELRRAIVLRNANSKQQREKERKRKEMSSTQLPNMANIHKAYPSSIFSFKSFWCICPRAQAVGDNDTQQHADHEG